jgi:hypothetical protein
MGHPAPGGQSVSQRVSLVQKCENATGAVAFLVSGAVALVCLYFQCSGVRWVSTPLIWPWTPNI